MSQVNGNPQQCAMVNASTNIVENIIIADPAVDPAPNGYILVSVSGIEVAMGWIYDPATGQFTDPSQP